MARGYSKLSVLAIGQRQEAWPLSRRAGAFICKSRRPGRSPGSFATSTPGGAATWG